MDLRAVAIPNLAMGKGRVAAKGKVDKPAKTRMAVKGNVDKIKTKAMHATVRVIKKVKTTNQWACLCPRVRGRRRQ